MLTGLCAVAQCLSNSAAIVSFADGFMLCYHISDTQAATEFSGKMDCDQISSKS